MAPLPEYAHLTEAESAYTESAVVLAYSVRQVVAEVLCELYQVRSPDPTMLGVISTEVWKRLLENPSPLDRPMGTTPSRTQSRENTSNPKRMPDSGSTTSHPPSSTDQGPAGAPSASTDRASDRRRW